MNRLIVVVAAACIGIALAPAASAMGKDPFRPVTRPAGSSAAPPGTAAAPGAAPAAGPVAASSPGGLPRTGIDLELPALAAIALLAAGGSMRLTARAFAS